MQIYQIDPVKDSRWTEFLDRHPKASVFHTVGWLQALQRTYGYEPVAFTTSPPMGQLSSGLVFCHIRSWLTGSRLVSLPFSDHCEPLCDSAEELDFLISKLRAALEGQHWKYLELRPVDGNFALANHGNRFTAASRYFLHTLSLCPDLPDLLQGFDKNCVQRRIRRAERAGLVEGCGRSEELLQDFYTMFVATRARHRIPPMPYAWFENLIQCQGEFMEIRVAYKDDYPISGILTLRFKDTIYYKYGCSDRESKKFGAIPWLLWRAIVAAKSNGAVRFDLGRTEENNAGLCAFKNHWAPHSKPLIYWKFPGVSSIESASGWKLKLAKGAFACMPNSLLKLTGRLLYRHIG